MADDYTPSTAAIRCVIRESAELLEELAPELGMEAAPPPAVVAGFDRWLETHDREVRADAVMGFATHYLKHDDWRKAREYAKNIREGNA